MKTTLCNKPLDFYLDSGILHSIKSNDNMFIYKEITEWDVGMDASCNHTYFFVEKPTKTRGKAIGYIPYGTDVYRDWSKPMDLELKGRKFQDVTKLKFQLL